MQIQKRKSFAKKEDENYPRWVFEVLVHFFEELCLPNLPSRSARSAHSPEWGLAVTISSFNPFLTWDYLALGGLWTVT